MTSTSPAIRSTIFKKGLSAGWPICLGYLPIGMAFGVLAQKAGLTPLQIALMSIMVFAGSAQFIAVAMLTGGASAPAIITTTFVVNLRHVLMSSALAVYLRAAHRGLLALYAYGVTDESFAVNLPRFNAGNWSLSRALVVNHAANLTWFISTVAGGIGGRFIPEGALGIDYALIAMFICPPAAARLMTDRLELQIWWSVGFATLSAILGYVLAGYGPIWLGFENAVSAAGMIATVSGVILGLAAVFGPHRKGAAQAV